MPVADPMSGLSSSRARPSSERSTIFLTTLEPGCRRSATRLRVVPIHPDRASPSNLVGYHPFLQDRVQIFELSRDQRTRFFVSEPANEQTHTVSEFLRHVPVQAAEKRSDWGTKEDLVGEEGRQIRGLSGPFATADGGALFCVQQECHIVLRQTGAFAVRAEIVCESIGRHGKKVMRLTARTAGMVKWTAWGLAIGSVTIGLHWFTPEQLAAGFF